MNVENNSRLAYTPSYVKRGNAYKGRPKKAPQEIAPRKKARVHYLAINRPLLLHINSHVLGREKHAGIKQKNGREITRSLYRWPFPPSTSPFVLSPSLLPIPTQASGLAYFTQSGKYKSVPQPFSVSLNVSLSTLPPYDTTSSINNKAYCSGRPIQIPLPSI